MDRKAVSHGTWQLHNCVAQAKTPQFAGEVDLTRPEIGVHGLLVSGKSMRGHVLGIQPERPSIDRPGSDLDREARATAMSHWQLVDSYLRGNDLVVTYEPHNVWPYTSQFYWSAVPSTKTDNIVFRLSLLVSLQTHLLDTWPKLTICSELPAEEVVWVSFKSNEPHCAPPLANGTHVLGPSTTPGCLMRRLVDSTHTFVEFMPASDYCELTVRHSTNGDCHTKWELFADSLEKGVIRRARMHSALIQRANDHLRGAAFCRYAEQQPLPLTA